MLAGIVCTLTGLFGILTARNRYSTYYWLFSFPYIIFAMACGIFMIIIAVLSSGAGNYVGRVSDDACAIELENG